VFDRSNPSASPAAIASILQPALQQHARQPSAGAGLDPCVLLAGLDQLQETQGITVSYAVEEIPATRAAAGGFRASLLAADYGPMAGYAGHAVATHMRAFAALCKQSRCVCLGVSVGVEMCNSFLFGWVELRQPALSVKVCSSVIL
jgi:hypothetical protein